MRKEYMEPVATVPLLIIDDFDMRKLPHTPPPSRKSSCAVMNASAPCSLPFVRSERTDLDLIFSLQRERVVNQDNTIQLDNRVFQIEKTR
jgi:hypothetical protein